MVCAIAVIVCVVGGAVLMYGQVVGRRDSQTRGIVATETFIAKTTVSNYSGITAIEFTGYSYDLSGYTSYIGKVNGVDRIWYVGGRPGASRNLQNSSGGLKDMGAYNEGWLGGDRSSGARLRASAIPLSDDMLDGVKVVYSTTELK
ncbi:hypothetical protein DF200_08505 [Bifidobacterium catulorum]|uniref:Uncharacterized protein n=1 Tax=Bifidobacterium catulorum TaxID=1630173 RepID=A0A2U2MQY7_9BIFI|nr:hypothetical protein DF200_08505 [Bifidobacterium catulorum]